MHADKRFQLLIAVGLVGASLLGGCGSDKAKSVSATESTTSTTLAARTGPVPYLLFDADGWSLYEAMDQSPPGEDLIRLKWSITYENYPSPNVQRPLAVAVADPAIGDAEHTAAALGDKPTKINLPGGEANAVEEHATTDGHLIATHVLWDVEGYVAWLTFYDTALGEASELATHARVVTKDEWYAVNAKFLAKNNTPSD